MSNQKQKIVKIGAETYVIDAFKGRKGLSLMPRIAKNIIPFLVGGDSSENPNLDKLNDERTAKMFMDLLSGDNADELINLVQDLLDNVTKGSVSIDFDDEFAQGYDKMIKLVIEVIMFNYKDSFQNLATIFPRMVSRG